MSAPLNTPMEGMGKMSEYAHSQNGKETFYKHLNLILMGHIVEMRHQINK